MKIIILAAGVGSRLGELDDRPKALTPLSNGQTILGRLLSQLSQQDICIITGYKKEQIEMAFPKVKTCINPNFATTNTAKSLLTGIQDLDDDLLWINGDVVCQDSVMDLMCNQKKSCLLVNQSQVDEEGVKYKTDSSGKITHVSKELKDAEGEALGINFLKKQDLPLFKKHLELCLDNDYFEKALESMIQEDTHILPIVIPNDVCIEVDFPEDFIAANQMLSQI